MCRCQQFSAHNERKAMSILDNEGHDPQGLGNAPRASQKEVLCACTDACEMKAGIERLRAALYDAREYVAYKVDKTGEVWAIDRLAKIDAALAHQHRCGRQMTQWRSECDRWRKAHDQVAAELRTSRDLIDHIRAFVRKKNLHDEFLEFLLSSCLGEAEATRLLTEVRAEKIAR